MTNVTTEPTALDRLTVDQRHALSNVAASFSMENMNLSTAELEVLARYVLGEISAAECDRLLDELP